MLLSILGQIRELLRNETILILYSLEPTWMQEEWAILEFVIWILYDFRMVFNTLIMHFLLNGTFRLPHTWTRSLFYPTFKFLFLHKSFGLNIWPSPICNSLLLVLLSSLFGAAIMFCLGFTNAFYLVLVLCLLILRPIFSTSSTVHKTLRYLLPLKIWSLYDDLQCLYGQNQLLCV